MITFFIAIVAFFGIKFLYDTVQQSNKIKTEGGIRKKYSTIVDYVLSSHPKARIFQEENTFVSVGVSGPAGLQVYYITPSYGNVSIRMKIKNNPLFGNQEMEWSFPENMNQEHMLIKINNDIEAKFKSLIQRYH